MSFDNLFQMRPNLENVSQRPGAMGRVFWVDHFNGNNGNSGTEPGDAFATIAYAMTQCTAGRFDTIMLFAVWQEAMPIAVNITTVHIIGVGGSLMCPSATLNASDDNDIFNLGSAGNNCEIAGISFGGGATSAGISLGGGAMGTCMGANIHHNVFGHSFAGDTPLHGIWCEATATAPQIEDNIFLGAGNDVNGTITGDGIFWPSVSWSIGGIIRNNYLLGCPGIALNMSARYRGGIIDNNKIALDADTAGAGITMGANATGNLITNNVAVFGEAAANNPYADGGAANANHWAGNQGPGGSLANTPWLLTA